MNPEIQYWLWRSEQRRRDADLERRRAYLQAHSPDPLRDPIVVAYGARRELSACEESGCHELVVAS
jgi:hypothetical protein